MKGGEEEGSSPEDRGKRKSPKVRPGVRGRGNNPSPVPQASQMDDFTHTNPHPNGLDDFNPIRERTASVRPC